MNLDELFQAFQLRHRRSGQAAQAVQSVQPAAIRPARPANEKSAGRPQTLAPVGLSSTSSTSSTKNGNANLERDMGTAGALPSAPLQCIVQCFGRERERFERELQRARGFDCFAVVVEADWRDLAGANYRSRLRPHAGCQSIAAFMARYGVPFLFAGSRAAAEYVAWSILRQYLEGAKKRLAALLRAHDASLGGRSFSDGEAG